MTAVKLFIQNRLFIRRINRLRAEYWADTDYWTPHWTTHLSSADRELFERIDLAGVPWNDEDEGHKHKLERWIDQGFVHA